MKFISVRDFRAGATALFANGSEPEDYILTNHGKPTAMVVPINEANFEDMLAAMRQVRALKNLVAIQQSSVAAGTDKMTMKEIDAEIQAVRKAKKRKA